MEINEVLTVFNKLYPNAKCTLNYNKDYELLIAVMLSAQTTDKAVNNVTKQLFRKYPSLSALKRATFKDISDIIHPLGMYKVKARNVIGIAKMLNGKVPNTREELMRFPGVGQKVANVVLMELYHLPYFAVDTHVARIFKRMRFIKKTANVKEIEEKALKIIPVNSLIIANHQFIEFGRNICSAKKPKCVTCPFDKMKCDNI